MSKNKPQDPQDPQDPKTPQAPSETDTMLSSGDQEVGNVREATLEEALAGVKIHVLAQVIEDRLRKMLAEGIPVEESLTFTYELRMRMEAFDAATAAKDN